MNDKHNPILPEGYEVPMAESNFFNKFPEGITCFRMLSPVTVGWRYWNLENRPVYSREKWEVQPSDAKIDEDNPWNPQHFWVFVAWVYESESIQVMQITQKKVMKAIKGYLENPKWGDTRKYDIAVTRTGTSMNDTDYSVAPEPPTPIPVEVSDAMKDISIKLDNVFTPEQHVLTSGPGIGTAAIEANTPPMTEEEQRQANGEPTDEEVVEQSTPNSEEINIEDIPF